MRLAPSYNVGRDGNLQRLLPCLSCSPVTEYKYRADHDPSGIFNTRPRLPRSSIELKPLSMSKCPNQCRLSLTSSRASKRPFRTDLRKCINYLGHNTTVSSIVGSSEMKHEALRSSEAIGLDCRGGLDYSKAHLEFDMDEAEERLRGSRR